MNDFDTTEPVQRQPSAVPPQALEDEPHHAEIRPLKIRHISMNHGWYWLIEGFTLWTRNPAFISFITFSFILIILAAAIAPYVGELLCLILMPGLALGVYNGCRAIDRNRKLSPGLLFSGFRRRPYDLLLAGFCNFIVTKAVLLSTILIDGGTWWRFSENPEPLEMSTIISPPFLYSMLTTAFLFVLWGMAYIFVPPLIGWWRLSVSKALSFSFKGCLFNWLAFTAYIFCFGFFVCTLSALAINFFNLLMDGLGKLACLVFLLIMSPALFASLYVAARDIYGLPRRRKHGNHPHPPQATQKKKRPQQPKQRQAHA